MTDGIVWLVLRMGSQIEINGVFSTEEKALAACEQSNDLVGPLRLDTVQETKPWEGAYYPILAMRRRSHVAEEK